MPALSAWRSAKSVFKKLAALLNVSVPKAPVLPANGIVKSAKRRNAKGAPRNAKVAKSTAVVAAS